MQRTFAPDVVRARTRMLSRGDRIEPLDLIEWLEAQGYEPEAQVTQKGEIASRGGILDVYPLTSPWPVRLEFFGDELESLRYFDPLTQLSRDQIQGATLPPAGELGLLQPEAECGVYAASTPPTRTASDVPIPAEFAGVEAASRPRSGANETLPQGSEAPQATRPKPHLATLIEYLPQDTICLVCEPELIDDQAQAYAEQIPPGDAYFIDWSELLDLARQIGMTKIGISEEATVSEESGPGTELASPDPGLRDDGRQESDLASLRFGDLEAFRPMAERPVDPQIAEVQRREFFHQLHRWLRQDYQVHVFCNNEGERQRFGEIWAEYGLDTSLKTEASHGPIPLTRPADTLSRSGGEGRGEEDSLLIHLGSLARGFVYEPGKLVAVTDAEIFGRYKVQRPRRLKSPHAVAARSALDIDFTELEEGDYVVHLQHGIGRYLGLKVLPVGSGRKTVGHAREAQSAGQECLVIEYAAGDSDQSPPKLYVPVTEAHLVSKYVGAGKARPVVNTLGGTRWAKAKAQAEEAVRDLAADLLAIQAARESKAGHAFAPDTPWQREFEGSFLYEETPDQERAILESKKDMETPRPMDRLICGDVGYGKTEVALRAAFKAVMDGKQVALLVPTTVLTQQHFNTFRERMAYYPVRMEQLSRFRSRREQQRIVEQVANGSIDIVIGTHRLLQEDISFKELGLVIIDEEQRFGVLHKEKLKRLRTLVDVLTLSATPIPRTLYLALTGARDMSTIETPPQDRLPVQTIVAKYDERLIRDAIHRELNRQGQVFYLHNRVQDIESAAVRVQTLAPSARVIVGHGQMHSDDLEEVMTRFVNGEADVLVCTTIIESGIDIPNANTIIIDRADRFGLSDLYQLRGRVGRYKHQAYAYLLLPRHAALLSDVRKRISAIRQYSSLGSGFKIAMRDLEIRGAGNLLGAEQSGHITAVGFELYCQLLKQSISTLKGEKVKPRVEVQVRLDFLALSPGEEGAGGSDQLSVISDQWAVGSTEGKSRKAGRSEEGADASADPKSAFRIPHSALGRAPAYIPFRYISEARQRIEIYRKFAQVTDKASLDRLRRELLDRFGKLPRAMELLLQVTELKFLASDRGITSVETREGKLMLTQNADYITLAGKFPRLTKKDARARLTEIKKLLLAL
jgi:transcription-repair coupling factor (superfamily II helicase)